MIIRAIALAVALAACGQQTAPQAETATATTGKPEAQAAAAPATITPAELVGRWGDNGDCTKDIVINADGTFTSYTGGSGTWSLQGDIMTMTGANGPFQVRVSILNGNQLLIGNPDGSIGTSQRC